MAYLGTKNRTYYAVFSINGSKKWIRIGNVDRKEARKVLRELELEHLRGKLDLKEKKEILLFDYLSEYLEHTRINKAKNTHRLEQGIASCLKAFFGNILLAEIDNRAIEGYTRHRVSKGLKPSSTNRELATLRFMLGKALEWGYLDRVPTIKMLKLPKQPPRFLSVDEMERLIECSSAWLRPILLVLRNTGMRIGEALSLKFSDVDLGNKVLLVRSQKTNNFRLVPINSELEETIAWLTRFYVNPSSLEITIRHSQQKVYLFCHSDGSRIRSIKTSFNHACTKAGIKATPHTIRHTFASHLVMNQVDLVSIKELLGHSSISTAMLYSHVSSDYKEMTVSRLPWLSEG